MPSRSVTSQRRHSETFPHHPAGLVVVQVREVAQISALFARVHKLAAEHPAKVHIVTAAPPVPVRPSWTSAAVITCARFNGPF